MTTYSDVKQRVFYDRDKVVKQRLRRKRSCGRLKQYNSEQDLRSWGTDQNDRRRHILEVMTGLKTLWGNYVPFDVLFGQLSLIAAGQVEKPASEDFSKKPQVSAYDAKDKGLKEPLSAKSTRPSGVDPKTKELEAQKKDLTGLVKSLTKDANDLRRDSDLLKADNDKLRGTVDGLEDQLKNLQGQLRASQDELEAKSNLENDLRDEEERAKELEDALENGRRRSQDLEDEKNEAEQRADALAAQLEGERRKSQVVEEELQRELENERRKSGLAKDAADRYKNQLEDERRKSKPDDEYRRRPSDLERDCDDLRKELEAARDKLRKQEKQLEDAADEDRLRRSMKMEECLRNELKSLESENDCLRKEIERLRMIECELADCEIKNQDLLCEIESFKCCLDGQEYENQKMTCIIKEQQDLIFNLQDVVTSNKSNENLQSESWASCNESIVEYQIQIEDLSCTVAKQKSLISSQGECLQRQHSYITQLEQIRCDLHGQVEVYKTRIKESRAEVESLCRKRKQLQQELDFLTNKLENYVERIQGLEKSQMLNSKSCGQTTTGRCERGGSISGYSAGGGGGGGGGGSSISKYSTSLQPEQDLSGRLSTSSSSGNRQPSCRSRSCQPGPKSKQQYGYR